MPNTAIDRRSILALIGAALVPIRAQAAQYPSRPIKIIVPFGPGGSGDISARLIGKQIEDKTKQAVVVDNRPGANGIIGTMAVKTAEPDGYTVLLITTSTHAANVSLVRNLSLRSGKGFYHRRRVPFQRQLSDGAAGGAVARSAELRRRRQGRTGQTGVRLFQRLVADSAGISRPSRRNRIAGRALSRHRQCDRGPDLRRNPLPVHGYHRVEPVSAKWPVASVGDHAA